MNKITNLMLEKMAKTESELNYAIGMDATILKTQVAGFLKGGNGETEILVLPTNVNTVSTLSFTELLEEVKKQFNIPKEDIEKAIAGIKSVFPDFSTDNLTFQLNQIFFHYKKEKQKTGNEEKAGIIEYAFSIKINLGGLLKLAGIISIDTLYMAIWNTNKESVLKQFNMADLSALLPK